MMKRLLALAMVFSMTIGATVTVYAAEETEQTESASGASEESAPASSAEPASSPAPAPAPASEPAPAPAAPVSEAVAQTVAAGNDASASIAAATEAAASIGMTHEVVVTELDLGTEVIPYLNEAAVYIDGGTLPAAEPAEEILKDADGAEGPEGPEETEGEQITGAFDDLSVAQSIIEKIEETDTSDLEENLEETQKELNTFKEKKNASKESAESAIANAETAGTTNSKKEAVEAKEQAELDLEQAEANLSDATDAYDAAWKKADEAQTAYEKALQEQEEAEKKIEEAKKALESAQEKSIAAQKALKKAQDNAAKIEERVAELKESRDELKAIRDQYYASMVYAYRTMLGKDVVYDEEDGSLDIEANAQKALETGKAEKAAISPDKTSMQLNRYLAKLLIDYMILHDENVDPETANLVFGAYEKNAESQKASQGTVFTNAQGQDQTVAEGTKKDIDGNTVSAGEQIQYYATKSKQNDGGRTNRIRVTYKDKDGVEHVEYYNYIYKSKKYKDEVDIQNGMVYLALVKYNDETEAWEASAVEDENNFDDFTELTKALEAIEELERYEQARAAVDEAAEKVTQLEEMIAELSIESPSNLSKLEDALDQARKELDDAYEKKNELEEVVEEARKAVAGIDLSRFDVHFVGDYDTEEVSPAAETVQTQPAPAEITEAEELTLPTIPVALTPMMPQVTPISGITAESPFSNITLAGTVQETRPQTTNTLHSYYGSVIPDAMTPDGDSQVLDDQEIAGAKEAPVDEKSRSWWLWLLIALASITGSVALKKKIEQLEAKDKT